jgi:hypothetical protein
VSGAEPLALARPHVPGRLAVHQHGHQVLAGVLAAELPELLEVGHALEEFVDLLLLGLDDAAGSGYRERDVGPPGELAAVLEREVEQGGQHQGGELDRDGVDPVEGLVDGQGFEHTDRALADERLEVAEVAGRRHAANRLALLGVAGRVHRDERLQPGGLGFHLGAPARPDRDATLRRERLPVAVDGTDVVVAGDRPVAPGGLDLVEVHRILGPEAGEVLLPAVLSEQVRVERVDLVDRELRRRRDTGADLGHLHLGRPDRRIEDGRLVCGVGHGRAPRSPISMARLAAVVRRLPAGRGTPGAMSAPDATCGYAWNRPSDGRAGRSAPWAERCPGGRSVGSMRMGRGFTHVELLPVMEHPFYGSWGYQTTGYFAPTSRYGTPAGLHVPDRPPAPARGIGVILDWVPSHFPTDEHGLAYFDGTHLYEHADPRRASTPTGAATSSTTAATRCAASCSSSALFWLDRTTSTGCASTRSRRCSTSTTRARRASGSPTVRRPREPRGDRRSCAAQREVYAEYPDVQTFAEESTAWPMVSRPTYVGGLGFGFKWDMGWMHDTLRTARDPVHRKYHHDELTFRMLYAFSENFVLPLSHDEVVHGKGSLLGQDAGRRLAEVRQPAAAVRLHVGAARARSCCSWAASSVVMNNTPVVRDGLSRRRAGRRHRGGSSPTATTSATAAPAAALVEAVIADRRRVGPRLRVVARPRTPPTRDHRAHPELIAPGTTIARWRSQGGDHEWWRSRVVPPTGVVIGTWVYA